MKHKQQGASLRVSPNLHPHTILQRRIWWLHQD